MRATLFSGKVVRLTDWAVRLPSPQLGCPNVSPSFPLSLSRPPSDCLVAILPCCSKAGGGFLHLPYLATCTAGPNAWIEVHSLFRNLGVCWIGGLAPFFCTKTHELL